MNYFFVNKNKRIKDKSHCQYLAKNYFETFVIKNLFKIKNRSLESKFLYLSYNQAYINNLFSINYNFRTQHKDISFLSGRTKFIITKYGIARTDFKKLMYYNLIPNVQKSSW